MEVREIASEQIGGYMRILKTVFLAFIITLATVPTADDPKPSIETTAERR
jgi:hypothetical protein